MSSSLRNGITDQCLKDHKLQQGLHYILSSLTTTEKVSEVKQANEQNLVLPEQTLSTPSMLVYLKAVPLEAST